MSAGYGAYGQSFGGYGAYGQSFGGYGVYGGLRRLSGLGEGCRLSGEANSPPALVAIQFCRPAFPSPPLHCLRAENFHNRELQSCECAGQA